jgi:hypothetical protein
MEIRNVYEARMKYKGKLIRGMDRWIEICRNRWFLMKN